ncbi:MAG TPA: O-antigen ligase family protein, partial [Actinomycetota bacterium]|nr:O-antigen ligase family protein [Actinomycetota bacterium]
ADTVFVLAIFAVLMWAGTNSYRLRAPYSVSVGIMMGAGLVAAVAGAYTRQGLVAIAQDLYLLIWAAAVANVMRLPQAARVLFRAWSYAAIVSAGLIVAGVALGWDALAGINPSIGSRAAFTFTDENSAGIYFAISIAIVVATGTPSSRGRRRLAILLLLAALLVTGSLAGFLALGVIMLTALTVSTFRRRGGAVAVALLTVVALAGLAVAAGVQSAHFFEWAGASGNRIIRDSLGREQQSTGSREVIIGEVIGLYVDGPLIGRGPASTRAWLNKIAAPYPKEAHDDYLATITERGIIGAIGLLLLIGAIKVRTTALHPRALRTEFNDVLVRPVWLLGAVASLAFVALTHEILHERTVWTLLGILAGVHAFGLRRVRPEGALS